MKTKITKTAGKTAKTIATAFAACALIFSSCKKGDTGPAGPAGTNGVANISTTVYTITPSQWNYQGTVNMGPAGSAYQFSSFITDANITNADQDCIQVYYSNTPSGGTWGVLPYSYYASIFTYTYSNGLLTLTYDLNSYQAPTNTLYIKIVVIPPAHRKAHPHVNYHSYNEVKATFNLKD